ncbi:hypothetical protein SIO70_15705 [Chitinophaga sancti]|uniref:hypothetical protein n=1 Tax=Chitinophaga sancti TaxID=1004 RepID=UPI002A756E26|nr:hypothetical protein [Chitinophaga sancti]WPQ66306.1 hypothetical protein SIO70_15705 [Chitinophaga sancti]
MNAFCLSLSNDELFWNLYGKIAKIYKHDTTSIVYAYDAAGNRISKSVISKTQDTVQTLYIRDATGNIQSTYAYRDTSVNSGQLSQIEANQSIGNYKYDSIGNMVSDVRAGVDSIKWNVYGKIAKI